MTTDKRDRARELRAAGLAIREIAGIVGVSQSSASIWVRDIVLTSDGERPSTIAAKEVVPSRIS